MGGDKVCRGRQSVQEGDKVHGGRQRGDFWPRLPIAHYHEVLCPEGTLHNDSYAAFQAICTCALA